MEEIAQYTLEHWGDERVDAYRARLMRSFRQLQTFPEIGRVTDDDPTIREFALEHHTIIYRHDADANLVTILRIVNPGASAADATYLRRSQTVIGPAPRFAQA